MLKKPRKTGSPGYAAFQAHHARKRQEFLKKVSKKQPRKKPAGRKRQPPHP